MATRHLSDDCYERRLGDKKLHQASSKVFMCGREGFALLTSARTPDVLYTKM